MSTVDKTHPLHAASLYVEELKYADRDRGIRGLTFVELETLFGLLLRDAEVGDVDPGQMADDCDFYAEHFARLLKVPVVLAKSVFVDGLMHGIALAGGLRGEAPK